MMLLPPVYRVLLRQTQHHHRSSRSVRGSIWIAVFVLVALIAAVIGHDKHNALASLRVLFVFATMFLIVAWNAFIKTMLALRAPGGAALVPNLRPRLARLVAAAWLALALPYGLLMASLFSLDAFACIVTFAFALCMDTFRRVLPPAFWLLVVAAVVEGRVNNLASFQFGFNTGRFAGAFLKHGENAAWAALLTLIASGIIFRQLLKAPGDPVIVRLRRMFSTSKPQSVKDKARDGALNLWFGRKVFGYSMKRAIRAGKASELFVYSLGPRAHWSMMTLPLFVLAALTLIPSSPSPHPLEMKIVAVSILFNSGITVTLMAFMVKSIGQARFRTRAEQALVRLAPGIAPGNQADRVLDGPLLRNAIFAWLGLVTVTLPDFFNIEPLGMRTIIAATLSSALMLAPLSLRHRTNAATEADYVMGIWPPVGLLLLVWLVGLLDARYALGGWGWRALMVAGPIVFLIGVRRQMQSWRGQPATLPGARPGV
jgi:hypothetical protein